MAAGDTPTSPIPNKAGVPVLHYGESFLIDGAITLVAGGIARLTKGSAGAYTLAVPTFDGVTLRIVALTAQAHVVTQGTVGFNAKGSSGTATFGGAIGDSCELISFNGNWYSSSDVNVTFA